MEYGALDGPIRMMIEASPSYDQNDNLNESSRMTAGAGAARVTCPCLMYSIQVGFHAPKKSDCGKHQIQYSIVPPVQEGNVVEIKLTVYRSVRRS